MKKKSILSCVMATMMVASCTTNAPESVDTCATASDSLKTTNPELWEAQNQNIELKADRSTMENPLDLNGFIQIAIIVEDIEASAREWSQLLNVPMPEIKVFQTAETASPDIMYYGKNYKFGLKLASIMAPQGFIIELHQILDDNPSTFNEFVKEHGYGVHHLGFAVGDRRDAVVNELVERGYPKRVEHIYEGGSWTIIDAEKSLGVNLNVKPAM
ncbi:MAG: VOC family protein [Bacteroidales bacterium]|nr:VOC family protein [Bacteroidales bacterium]